MSTLEELELPTIGLTDTDLVGEPFHEALGALAEHHWLVRMELGYVVLARDAVDTILRTRHARMPAIELLELQGVTSGPIHDQLSGNLLNLHGEPHRRLRGLVQSSFTPAAAERLRPTMRGHLEDLWAQVDPENCEFVTEIAKPYPARMIAEIVGAPVTDDEQLGEWAYWLQSTFDPSKVHGSPERIEQAAIEFRDYVQGLLRSPSPSEGPDALLPALRPEVEAGTLSEDECVSLIGSVLLGGVDTTQAQLAHAVRLFAEHPDQWAALRDDHSRAAAAVDEVLRYEPITPFTARLVTEEFTERDVTFPPGTVLVVCAATANRDPSVYDAPDVFDITADRGGVTPLTFGAGPHFCLGHALARAELEEALAFLAQRVRDITLTGPPRFDTPAGVYGLHELPVRLAPAV
jgi:cytochrome P450